MHRSPTLPSQAHRRRTDPAAERRRGIIRACERWCITCVVCLVATGGGVGIGAFAVQGGKAEPVRIRIPRGHESVTVGGTLRGDAQTEYVFDARKGQRVTIRLSATPSRSVRVDLKGAADVHLPLESGIDRPASVVLSDDGDQEIWVKRVAGPRGRSQYRLTLTIR